MKKWFRWQGLLAFIVIVGGLAALWIIFIDSLVERAIEKAGMAIVGAEVDVRARVSLVPLAVTLEQLQVTNPEEPATNSVECRRIAFSLDSFNLLRRKIIINEMAVEGVRFDTPRKRPGAVKKRAAGKKPAEKQPLFSIPVEKPDVKKILQNENLESVKLIESARGDLEKKKAEWQKRVAALPDKAKLDAYRARIDKLKQAGKGNILGMAEQAGEVRALRRDLEQDIGRVRTARSAFTNDLASTKALVARASRAPLDDARRLRDKYSISPAGLANMTQLLFGDKISSWVRSGLLWYNRVQPVVERARRQKGDVKVVKHLREKGVDVRFREYRPLPDFLIDRTAVSAETTAGLLAGTIRNITPDQDILGAPLTFSLSGEKLRLADAVSLTGTLNHIIASRPDDSARFSVRALKVKDLVLSNLKELPIAIQEGIVDFNLDGSFTNALKARVNAKVNSARMNVGGEGASNVFVAAVRSALSKVSAFSLSGNIEGTLENYKLNISSDLDKVLKNAAGSVVREQGDKLEQELRTAIAARTGGQLQNLQQSFNAFGREGTALDDIQNRLNGLLQDALKSAGGGRFRLP